MKKFLLIALIFLFPSFAWAQCNGVFPANTYCGNNTGSPAVPGPVPPTAIILPNNSVTNSQLAQVPPYTVKGNCTGSTANVQDCTLPIIFYLCNGTSDSTGLNAALINAETIVPNGGLLHISGTCALTSPLSPTTNVTIEGDGQVLTSLNMSSSAISCINFNPSSTNQAVNLRRFTCNYASLSSSGATAIQYGNNSFNNAGGVIEEVVVLNATAGIFCENCINVIIAHNSIQNFYGNGVFVYSPLSPDAGGVIIHDNYIQTFSPLSLANTGILWQSGGAFYVHDNQIFASIGIYLHESQQTSELNINNNLFTGTGTPQWAIKFDALSASFTCTQSGTNMTVSAVTGTIVVQTPGALSGQTITGTGVAAGTTFVSQTSGTPGGAGVYVTSLSGTASSAACLSTLILTELNITGNTFDNTGFALATNLNTGGVFLDNLIFANNTLSSVFGLASTNVVQINSTLGFTVSGNLFKCNGNCTGSRPVFADSTSSNGLIIQTPISEPGNWGAADFISATNVNPSKTCGGTIVVNNGVITSC